jgi:predicted SAM-dependent methyltransferase
LQCERNSGMKNSRLLNLGCGKRWHPDWRNVDLISTAPEVEAIDLLKPWPFEHNFYDAIYCSHVLEHIPRKTAPQFVRQCWDVLKPGGILRIVVPDLEGICREYLHQLEAARNNVPGAHLKHRWMTLELLDQMVRTESGGLMGKLWCAKPLEEKPYIIDRLGEEAAYWIEFLAQQDFGISSYPEAPDIASHLADVSPQQEQTFRDSGEIHRWMYDEVSLSILLQGASFVSPKKMSSATSAIPNFSGYHLDTDHAGKVRKPDSLFLEAMRPTTKGTAHD